MKYDGEKVADDAHVVTPFAGVWIEIVKAILSAQDRGVTPFAGVWIEISRKVTKGIYATVSPFAGVWIEIP